MCLPQHDTVQLYFVLRNVLSQLTFLFQRKLVRHVKNGDLEALPDCKPGL